MTKGRKPKGATPLMKQYYEIKAKYPQTLLLFRVGDFYETFEEDAKKLHEIADIKLAKRSNGSATAIDLAGFPYHALDVYLPKLIRAGLRVAVCDQMEAAQKGKEIVERKVTELVTPGLTYHDHVLDTKQNNYLASIHFAGKILGIAFLDISTGEFLTTQGEASHIAKLIQGLGPSEIIFNKKHNPAFQTLVQDQYHHFMLEDWVYSPTYAYKLLKSHFGTATLKGFGIEEYPEGVIAAGAILHYLKETEQCHLQHIIHISRIEKERYMWLDRFTIRNLELLRPQQEDGVSLLSILDKTVTPMGARRIKKWLLLPLKELPAINKRLDMVTIFVEDKATSKLIFDQLKQIGDLERLISKVASKRINPRELQVMRRALEQIVPIQKNLQQSAHPLMVALQKQLCPCDYIISKIATVLQEQPPMRSNQGGVIQPGISPELDELRSIAFQGNVHLQKIQETEREKTGIASLKIGYNKVFGYYLEVRHTHKNKIPANWVRKQTLVNAERYITEELKRYEEQILHAQERIGGLEQELYQQLVQEIAYFVPQVQQNAKILSHLDCYYALARIAVDREYVRPTMNMGKSIEIEAGRHPVIEQHLPVGQDYVPNDIVLNEAQQILLITGPNMAGKSALLRQMALIVLMAHLGSFVPAKKATIGIVDKIFTRVGASDNIAKQQSTFMVEMNEMASILNNLSDRSLIIVDELGRGTGTADGLALAQSIIVHIHNHPKYLAKMLFATHYHELNELEGELPKLKNYKVVVKEIEGQLLFLHKLVLGSSQNSFGIQVAKMAGIPKTIIMDALGLIQQLKQSAGKKSLPKILPKQTSANEQIAFFAHSERNEPIIKALKAIDVHALTPIEALVKLEELKFMLL